MLKEPELSALLETIDRRSPLIEADAPNIDLYMDQVTTFMEEHLGASKRYSEDKILTKTMINNYTKNHLLPPPVKKKYSREHLYLMIFIYSLKGILSLSDIQTLLKPLNQTYFNNEDGIKIADIYEEACRFSQTENDALKEDILRQFEKAGQTWTSEEDREQLQTLSFLMMLSYDVYVKKMVIENLIDQIKDTTYAADPKAGKKNDKK